MIASSGPVSLTRTAPLAEAAGWIEHYRGDGVAQIDVTAVNPCRHAIAATSAAISDSFAS
jgi:hypothetical protein